MATKAQARRLITEAIKRLTESDCAARSAAISERLLKLPELKRAETVMGYLSMPDELDTAPLLQDLIDAGKRIYVPRTDPAERWMTPVRLYDLDHLREGAYGILEPPVDETCVIGDLDLLLVPARAFDREGNRLGRGAGFYDRFMADPEFKATRCGACFECQVLPSVPHTPHDIPVQILVTEDRTLRFST